MGIQRAKKRESRSKQNDEMDATMRLIEQLKQNDMKELEKRQRELQQKVARDAQMAKSIYNDQMDLHNNAWNVYGAPQVDKMKKERKIKMDEKQRKKAEKRKEYMEKHFISADKIGNTRTMKNDNDEDKNKKPKQEYDEEQNQYLDPNDGMGLVIMDSDAE